MSDNVQPQTDLDRKTEFEGQVAEQLNQFGKWRGWGASYEYPGYVLVKVLPRKTLVFGQEVNGAWSFSTTVYKDGGWQPAPHAEAGIVAVPMVHARSIFVTAAVIMEYLISELGY